MPSPTWSPYANPLLRWPGVLLLIALVWNPGGHGDGTTQLVVSTIAKLLLVGIAVYGLLRYTIGNGPFARMKRLQRDLPWFSLRPVTCHPLEAEPDLPAQLARHDYTVLELDGRTIRTWADLAQALEAQFGAMRFPSDPMAKCASILMHAAYARPRRRVLLWRHATSSLAHDPSLVIGFASTWASMATTVPPGLLLFVDLPAQPIATPPAAADQRHYVLGERDAEPDRTALAGAPRDAWWKPQPGDLTS